MRRCFPIISKASDVPWAMQRQYCGALGKTANCQLRGEPAPRRRGGGHEPAAFLAAVFARELGGGSRSLPARGVSRRGSSTTANKTSPSACFDQALGWKWADRAWCSPTRPTAAVSSGVWPCDERTPSVLLRARAVDDHRLARGATLRATRSRAPGLSRQARTAAQPGTKDLARHRAESCPSFGVEDRDLAAGHQGAATLALCPS